MAASAFCISPMALGMLFWASCSAAFCAALTAASRFGLGSPWSPCCFCISASALASSSCCCWSFSARPAGSCNSERASFKNSCALAAASAALASCSGVSCLGWPSSCASSPILSSMAFLACFKLSTASPCGWRAAGASGLFKSCWAFCISFWACCKACWAF